MTTFPRALRLLKGGLVLVHSEQAQCAVLFPCHITWKEWVGINE